MNKVLSALVFYVHNLLDVYLKHYEYIDEILRIDIQSVMNIVDMLIFIIL